MKLSAMFLVASFGSSCAMSGCSGSAASDDPHSDKASDTDGVDTDVSALEACVLQTGCYVSVDPGVAPPPVEVHFTPIPGTNGGYLRWKLVGADALPAIDEVAWSSPELVVDDRHAANHEGPTIDIPAQAVASDLFLVAEMARSWDKGWPWTPCSVGRGADEDLLDEGWVEPECPSGLTWPSGADMEHMAWIAVGE